MITKQIVSFKLKFFVFLMKILKIIKTKIICTIYYKECLGIKLFKCKSLKLHTAMDTVMFWYTIFITSTTFFQETLKHRTVIPLWTPHGKRWTKFYTSLKYDEGQLLVRFRHSKCLTLRYDKENLLLIWFHLLGYTWRNSTQWWLRTKRIIGISSLSALGLKSIVSFQQLKKSNDYW